MTTNKTSELIEPYLLGELDAEQTAEFEQAVAADPMLAREVERMQALIGAFERRGETPAREALLRIGSEQVLRDIIRRTEGGTPARRTPRIPRIVVWCAAAAVVAALMIGVGRMPEYPSKTLFDTYFTTDQHFEIAPSRGGDELPEDARLNRALMLLNAGQTDTAIGLLRPLADDDQAELQDAARWNLALALLRRGDRNESIEQLDALIADGGGFAARAAELKTKIGEKRWF